MGMQQLARILVYLLMLVALGCSDTETKRLPGGYTLVTVDMQTAICRGNLVVVGPDITRIRVVGSTIEFTTRNGLDYEERGTLDSATGKVERWHFKGDWDATTKANKARPPIPSCARSCMREPRDLSRRNGT